MRLSEISLSLGRGKNLDSRLDGSDSRINIKDRSTFLSEVKWVTLFAFYLQLF